MIKNNPELEQKIKNIAEGKIFLSAEEKEKLTAAHVKNLDALCGLEKAFRENRISEEKRTTSNVSCDD